ncbi:MAG: Maf family protein [Gammaproteobacteria bacterium]|nr:Maf family protein [Gammaproteobacteria bacterium]
MKIILGSASKSRQAILSRAGYSFEVISADIDEKQIRYEYPSQLTMAIARAKADDLLKKIKTPALLVTSDTVVTCNGEIFEKPNDEEEARYFLHCYNRFPASTTTAVLITNTETSKCISDVDIAYVYFHPIPESEIEKLIAIGDIFHFAGALQVEALDDDTQLNPFVSRIEGTIESLQGLPIHMFKRLLEEIKTM